MKRRSVISLFSGCGGMDLGFEGDFEILEKSFNPKINPNWRCKKSRDGWLRLPKTSFEVVIANDILLAAKNAWKPYFASRNEAHFLSESVVDLVKRHKQGEKIFPHADVITGGFPCQDFSVAGKRLGFSSHKSHLGVLRNGDVPDEESRGKLYMWMRAVIELVKPKIFIAENVKGLVSLGNVKATIQKDFSKIGKAGYLVVEPRILRAQDYGVPQTRERVIFIGFRKDLLLSKAATELSQKTISEYYDPYPIPTHGAGDVARKSYVSVSEALRGLTEPEKSKDLSQQTFSKARWYGNHCQGNKEVDLDLPGPTIRAEHHGNIEFRRLEKAHGGMIDMELKKGLPERRLTVRECARIQTFPDDYEFVRGGLKGEGTYGLSGSDGYRVLGNAVPPLLGYHLASNLQEKWKRYFGEKG